MAWKLMRTWYETDAADEPDPDYVGAFSSRIPDRAFSDGATIVDVDWSERGHVQVTYLIKGP